MDDFYWHLFGLGVADGEVHEGSGGLAAVVFVGGDGELAHGVFFHADGDGREGWKNLAILNILK